MTKKLNKTSRRQKEVLNSVNCGYSFPVLAERYKVTERGIKRIFFNAVMKFGEFQKL